MDFGIGFIIWCYQIVMHVAVSWKPNKTIGLTHWGPDKVEAILQAAFWK